MRCFALGLFWSSSRGAFVRLLIPGCVGGWCWVFLWCELVWWCVGVGVGRFLVDSGVVFWAVGALGSFCVVVPFWCVSWGSCYGAVPLFLVAGCFWPWAVAG